MTIILQKLFRSGIPGFSRQDCINLTNRFPSFLSTFTVFFCPDLPYTSKRLALKCAVQWEIVGIQRGRPKFRPFWYSTIVYLAQELAKYIWQIVYSLIKMNGHILNVQSDKVINS